MDEEKISLPIRMPVAPAGLDVSGWSKVVSPYLLIVSRQNSIGADTLDTGPPMGVGNCKVASTASG